MPRGFADPRRQGKRGGLNALFGTRVPQVQILPVERTPSARTVADRVQARVGRRSLPIAFPEKLLNSGSRIFRYSRKRCSRAGLDRRPIVNLGRAHMTESWKRNAQSLAR